MKQPRITKDQLLSKYPDTQWRQRLLRIADLVRLLEGSILRPDYKIPDDLNNAIALSETGERIQKTLIIKQQVPAKEAKLICLLELAHVDLLIDVDKTDVEGIADSLSKQVLDGSLRYAMVFGRDLYNRAAELFEEERDILTYDDTLRLLEAQPVGVSQVGRLVLGPLGLLEGSASRWTPPTTRPPLYHCADFSCDAVHRCQLSTDKGAAINEHRYKVQRILDADGEEPSAWGAFLAEIAGFEASSYNDQSANTLPFLLGDALADKELRTLAVALIDGTRGELRRLLAPLGLKGSADNIVGTLDRASLLQVTLLCRDDDIVSLLDRLVAMRHISVPATETRAPVVNRAAQSGQFSLQAQLGPFGVRFHARTSSLGPLRLRRLIDSLYVLDQDSDVSELEWQLRGVEAPSLDARLDEFVRNSTPRDVVERLVLARRTNMIAACTQLGIDEHRAASDRDLVNTVLWKLGFDLNEAHDVNGRFWQLHEKMKQVTQTAGVSALVDQEAVRALASNYFVLLEQVLDDALAFSTWALTTDHVAADAPFSYRPLVDRLDALKRLDAAEQHRDAGPEILRFGDKNALYELCRGFASLATYLGTLVERAEDYTRPEGDEPKFVKHTSLKFFPFKHTVVFLDLVPSGREGIVETLRETTRLLVAADVNGVRNDQLHFRRSTADLGRLSACLAAVEEAVARLERLGLARLLFHPKSQQGDEWGRRIVMLADARGREIAFARPSSYDWLQLPSLRTAQYLATGAVFSEPNEILRFRLREESDFSRMSTGYPLRRKTSGSLAASMRPTSSEEARTAGV